MKSVIKKLSVCLLLVTIFATFACAFSASADTDNSSKTTAVEQQVKEDESSSVNGKAIGASIAIGLAALGGAIAMGMTASKASEAIARQPEAESKIRSTFMLGLVFVETAIIYALVVAILIIFVM